jgi:glycosyltransferase involved in cell wall biosynthesis
MAYSVDVLIPVYNGAKYLSDCISGICAQTYAATNIIVVDDGSEDSTAEVVRAWGSRVGYHRVPHGGLPYARNQGLRRSTSEFVAFVDSDDIWTPWKLQVQFAALAKAAEPSMVFGHVQQFISDDLTPHEARGIKCDPAPLRGLFPSALLIRRSDCERVGPFNESIQTGEFIEWCSRAADAGIKTIVVPDIVCHRRLHRSNMGRGGASMHVNYVRMIKTVLDRRRGQARLGDPKPRAMDEGRTDSVNG